MLKIVSGPAPYCVACQTNKFEEMVHLPLNEQFKILQKQAQLEVMAEEWKHPVQTVILTKFTPKDITLEMYSSLRDLKKIKINKLLTVHNKCQLTAF